MFVRLTHDGGGRTYWPVSEVQQIQVDATRESVYLFIKGERTPRVLVGEDAQLAIGIAEHLSQVASSEQNRGASA